MSYYESERYITLENDQIKEKAVRLYATIEPGKVSCGFYSQDRWVWHRDILICDNPTDFALLRGKFLTETKDNQYESLCSKCQSSNSPSPNWSIWNYFFPPSPVIDTKANDFAARMCKDFFVCLQYLMNIYGSELMHFAFYAVGSHHPIHDSKMTYSEFIQFTALKFIVARPDIVYRLPFKEKKNWKTGAIKHNE